MVPAMVEDVHGKISYLGQNNSDMGLLLVSNIGQIFRRHNP